MSDTQVTQADRDALADAISDMDLMSELSIEHIRLGRYDGCTAIAAHRTRSTATLKAQLDMAVAVVQSFIDRQLEHGDSDKHELLCNVRDKILAAIKGEDHD